MEKGTKAFVLCGGLLILSGIFAFEVDRVVAMSFWFGATSFATSLGAIIMFIVGMVCTFDN